MKYLTKMESNIFLEKDLIPLGRNTFWDRVKERKPVASKYGAQQYKWVAMPYKRNGVITILGGSSVGKSVTGKKIFAWYMLPQYFGGKHLRKAVIFDYQGDDHRLIVKPNGSMGNDPFPLIYGIEKPMGFKDAVVNYTPKYLEDDCFFDDKFFGFTLSDFHYEDWYSLRIQEASLETLQELIKLNKRMSADPQHFYENFKNLTTRTSEMSNSEMQVDERISDMEKRHLRKLLRRLIDEKVVTERQYKVDFVDDMYKGKIVIFNFHEDEIFSPFYMSAIARKLYNWARGNTRKKGHTFLNPVLLLEEAQIPLDRTDINLSSGANKWITKYLKQGNKYQNLVMLLTQAITEVHKSVRNHAVKQEVILGNPVASDLAYFKQIWRPEVVETIKTLDWENRELCLVHNGGNYCETFISNNSMTQIHLR